MKARTTVILFGVFIILLVFVYLLEGPLSERKQKEEKGGIALFPDFNKNKATKIAVKSTTQEVSLERKGKDWSISDTDGFTADPQLINDALDTVKNFNRENIASKNSGKQELFEVVSGKGVEITISDSGQKMLAHFYIGKTGPDFFSVYLRKEGSDGFNSVARACTQLLVLYVEKAIFTEILPRIINKLVNSANLLDNLRVRRQLPQLIDIRRRGRPPGGIITMYGLPASNL